MRHTSEFPHTPYTDVARRFVDRWKRCNAVIGALMVGSYASDPQTPMSDIDICILLKDTERKWRRGHAIKDGYLIEYAAYPLWRLRELQEADVRAARRLRTRMLADGIPLYDADGTVQQLQTEAVVLLQQRLPIPLREKIEMDKYFLWDQLDNLRDMHMRYVESFAYAYFACLQRILEVYAAALGAEVPRPNKLHRFFTDAKFRQKYRIEKFPDEEFASLFASAMHKPDLASVEALTKHVLDNTGGFNVARWRLSGIRT